MQSRHEYGVQSKTPYKYYIEAARTAALRYGVRAPRVPDVDQYAPAWEVPDELALPHMSRGLGQIHHFKDLGQDLGLSCYRYFQTVGPELVIDWKAEESSNIRLPADGVPRPIEEQSVDDLRSFRKAIYGSIIVTAMEMARLLYGGSYKGSYRYSRDSTVNLVRGARWDVLPYTQTGPAAKSKGTHMYHEPDETEDPKMVVICVPPWDLSRLDLEDFSTQRTLAAGELDLTPGNMRTSKASIIWAVVYEACRRANCSYFVVTTYDYWIFGNMSKSCATASVSSVFDFSERSGVYQQPNLLQLLTYWELASIGTASWDIPLDEDVVS